MCEVNTSKPLNESVVQEAGSGASQIACDQVYTWLGDEPELVIRRLSFDGKPDLASPLRGRYNTWHPRVVVLRNWS